MFCNINIDSMLFEVIHGTINDSKILMDNKTLQYGYCIGYFNAIYNNDIITSFEFLQAKQLINFYFDKL